jgi:hypothetical protein
MANTVFRSAQGRFVNAALNQDQYQAKIRVVLFQRLLEACMLNKNNEAKETNKHAGKKVNAGRCTVNKAIGLGMPER